MDTYADKVADALIVAVAVIVILVALYEMVTL